MIGPGFISRVSSYADIQGIDDEPYDTGVAGLSVYRSRKASSLRPCLYKPTFCLVLQGSKEVHVGEKRVVFTTGETLIVSHDIPMISRIVEASNDAPYLALSLPADIQLMRGLVNEIGEVDIKQDKGETLNVGKADTHIVDALERLFALVDQPVEAKVIAPLIVKEIYFRLLMAPHGAMLRHLLQQGSPASRISKVLSFIKKEYSKAFTVAELAEIAMMSSSSFYEYFKTITSTTPLQYQKEIRLLEARRLLMDFEYSVSEVAFNVGYQSPTQFSREYSRKFGTSPSVDKKSVRNRTDYVSHANNN